MTPKNKPKGVALIDYRTIVMQEIVISKIRTCADMELLDLIDKLLIQCEDED